MVQFYTFKATFTCLIELKIRKSIKKYLLFTRFALSSNKTPLRHYSLRRPFAWDGMGVCWEGAEAGYVIFMGLEYFQKLLDKPMKGRVILEGVNIF